MQEEGRRRRKVGTEQAGTEDENGESTGQTQDGCRLVEGTPGH